MLFGLTSVKGLLLAGLKRELVGLHVTIPSVSQHWLLA